MTIIYGAGLLILVVVGIFRWRVAVYGVLLLVIYEGALRKWVLPSAQEWIYFAKDALLLGSYVGFYGQRLSRGHRLIDKHLANPVLAFLTVVCTLEVLNPSLPTAALGVFGWVGYVFFIPLMYMVPHLFADPKMIRRFSMLTLLASLGPLLIGPAQFASSPDSFLNRYAQQDVDVVTTGFGMNQVRVTGTFPYITGYTTFLILLAVVVLALAIHSGTRHRQLFVGALVLIFANMYMTGSRGPFMSLAIAVPLMLVMALRMKSDKEVRLVVFAIMVIPLTLALANQFFPDARTAFMERTRENNDIEGRIVGIFTAPVWAVGEAGAAGWGIGSTHQAAHFFIPQGMDYNPPPAAEGEWERIVLETGPTGLLLMLAARVLVLLQLWRSFRAAHGSPAQPFVAAAFAFGLIHLSSNLVFNPTADVLFWFMAGFAFVPRYLQARERAQNLGYARPAQARVGRTVTGVALQ